MCHLRAFEGVIWKIDLGKRASPMRLLSAAIFKESEECVSVGAGQLVFVRSVCRPVLLYLGSVAGTVRKEIIMICFLS